MMTTGSKIYFKVAGAVWALAVVYGYVTETVSVGIWKGLSGDGVISSVLGPLTFGYKGGVGDHFVRRIGQHVPERREIEIGQRIGRNADAADLTGRHHVVAVVRQ